MSRGGRQRGKAHLPIESCHSMSAWGYFQWAQMWQTDFNFEIEWTFEQRTAVLQFKRQGIQRSQYIDLTWTSCNYGNARPWFACPDCNRRVGKLYLPETMYIEGTQGLLVYLFSCRHCYDLTYLQRQSRDQYWTYQHRAERLGERWLDVDETHIHKKKWQRVPTFHRRAAEYNKFQAIADAYGGASFAKLMGKFKRSH
jgi:hypothetical protein